LFLSSIFTNSKYTESIINIFKTDLPLIINTVISNFDGTEEKHLLITISLSKAIVYHPNLIEYLKKHINKYPRFMEYALSKKVKKDIIIEILKASYRILSNFCKDFENKWSWSPFFELYSNEDEDVSFFL
jgi:hypothetical protein